MRIELSSLGTGVAQNALGSVVPNTRGTLFATGTLTPVPVYTLAVGGSADTSGIITTDAQGRLPGWIDGNQTVDITIAPAPTVTVFVPAPNAVVPGSPLGLLVVGSSESDVQTKAAASLASGTAYLYAVITGGELTALGSGQV